MKKSGVLNIFLLFDIGKGYPQYPLIPW